MYVLLRLSPFELILISFPVHITPFSCLFQWLTILSQQLRYRKSGEPKVGVNNERFSTKVKIRCKLDIHAALLSPPVYLRRRAGLQCFQGVT